MKILSLSTIAALSLSLAACGGKKDEAGGGTAKPAEGKGGAAAAPAVKLEYKKLGATGLEAEVPADANVDDNTASAGFPSATIWASPTTFLMGQIAADDYGMIKQSYEATKEQVQKEAGTFKAFTKDEKTADGWHLEWTAESMGDQVTGILIRRVIDGKAWDCSTNSSQGAADLAKVAKICMSVRKAP